MSETRSPFRSIYTHGFLRVAAATPLVRVADPAHNAAATIRLARQADGRGAALTVFPELGLTAYSNDDLFLQDALLDAGLTALGSVVEASRELGGVLVVGAPLRFGGRLFNCAAVIHRGRLLGAVPKTYLPNYREFYEKRQFCSGAAAGETEVTLLDQRVPFGSGLIFEADGLPDFRLHVEICEDLWAPVPPSTWAALAGALVLANPSASNITIAKADYRRDLCAVHSGRCVAAYVFVTAGAGESTTELAWDGQALIHENYELLAESERFADEARLTVADVDLERLRQDRMRLTTFHDCARLYAERTRAMRTVRFPFEPPRGELGLEREIERFPYVPAEPHRLDETCAEAYNIQVAGLTQRLRATGIERTVVGVSGGLDSTQALLVATAAADRLGLPRANVLAYTLPGFATTERTLANARRLMAALGVSAHEIDIRPASRQMLRDIGHPAENGADVYDVTFENVQAGARAAILFRLANQRRGLVVGTSDLSELALGWTTYGVGDQMSHYAVNASVPKTLVLHLIRWNVRTGRLGREASAVLEAILATAISPELVPHSAGDEHGPGQSTEEVVGPFDLQDFNLYFISRYGFRPSKVAFLALHAWGDASRGRWPATLPESARREYGLGEIRRWLEVFLRRFFELSQFKRSAMPNAPKVGSGGSLSPRGDWRAPSDASAAAWLAELERNVPREIEREVPPRQVREVRARRAGSVRAAGSAPSDRGRRDRS